ncbi:hypothetical protein AB4Z01_06410 [Inquilinus sp. YAF38]|uniref:hypothetical protein n=1 Tax=Inquilinus sp. YAF38 TaxID=3233084 RepID=UPI003F8EDD83
MKTMIIESSYPVDFYNKNLDGDSVSSLLKTIGIDHELRYVLDEDHFHKSIEEASQKEFDIVHLSCHGDEIGIALADDTRLGWKNFSDAFQIIKHPFTLIMSSCCGASSGIGDSFRSQKNKPAIIFGSTDALDMGQYAIAWSILYYKFRVKGVDKNTAQEALRQIVAVSDKSFIYRRWDDDEQKYLIFPNSKKSYEIKKTDLN